MGGATIDCYLLAWSKIALKFSSDIAQRILSSLKRLNLTKIDNMVLFVCSEAVKSKLVKLETGSTVIFPPTVSVHCMAILRCLNVYN